MLAAYLCALVASVGIFVLQLAHGADQDHEVHDDHDHDDGDEHSARPWTLLISVRFWSFALLAFGLVGTALTLLQLTGPVVAGAIAVVMGVTSGLATALLLRWLRRSSPSSHATSSDVVGRVGRVLVPIEGGARGKVRVEVKGHARDFVASSGDALREGETVVVEGESTNGEIVVSRAPSELA